MTKKTDWIPLADRAPMSEQRVLAWDGEFAFDAAYVDDEFFCDLIEQELEGVTHWTPLEGPE